jgi:hypothetical protein
MYVHVRAVCFIVDPSYEKTIHQYYSWHHETHSFYWWNIHDVRDRQGYWWIIYDLFDIQGGLTMLIRWEGNVVLGDLAVYWVRCYGRSTTYIPNINRIRGSGRDVCYWNTQISTFEWQNQRFTPCGLLINEVAQWRVLAAPGITGNRVFHADFGLILKKVVFAPHATKRPKS